MTWMKSSRGQRVKDRDVQSNSSSICLWYRLTSLLFSSRSSFCIRIWECVFIWRLGKYGRRICFWQKRWVLFMAWPMTSLSDISIICLFTLWSVFLCLDTNTVLCEVSALCIQALLSASTWVGQYDTGIESILHLILMDFTKGCIFWLSS